MSKVRWTQVRRGVELTGWAGLLVLAFNLQVPQLDARTYYDAGLGDMYRQSTLLHLGYVYSPAFSLAMEPFRLLPFDLFARLVLLISLLSLGYLVTPWLGILLVLLMAPSVWIELVAGNLDLPLAAVLVFIYRGRPLWWAAVLLTKVTPAVGLIWYVSRREWTALRDALAATVVVIAASLPFTWSAWSEWFGVLTGQNVAIAGTQTFLPFWFRLVLAGAIVLWAARTSQAWLVPLAIVVSFPIPNEAHWSVLLASLRLWRTGGEARVSSAPAG